MEAVLQKNFSNVKLTEVEAEYAAIQKEKYVQFSITSKTCPTIF
jgi:hypothetical protein